MPTQPPITHTTQASILNCFKMSPGLAPVAMRSPISRFRSDTFTNIMFITPIPPTNSDMPATDASNQVRVFWVSVTASTSESVVRTITSSLPWRAVRMARASSCTPDAASVDAAFMVIPLKYGRPKAFKRPVEIGINTSSSMSLPPALAPLDFSTPIT